jgi:hypothetical protein
MRMHCTRLVVVLNTTYQLVFWNASRQSKIASETDININDNTTETVDQ